jgi:hypothetical protein
MQYLCAGYDTCDALCCRHNKPHDRMKNNCDGIKGTECECLPMKTREELNEESEV